MERVYYDGVCVAVKVTSGRRFTYRASVASNELLVCVPNRTSRQVLTDFIVKTVQKKREEGVFNDYRDGGFIYLFGEKRTVRAYPTEEKRARVTLTEEDVFIATPAGGQPYVDYAVKKLYEKELQKRLLRRVPVMESYVGLQCASWKLATYHAAWGKCNHRDKTITFSLDLATQSPEFIDTVIIHELGHLSFPNHGADFQKYMDRFAPNHRKVLKNAIK